MVWTRRKGKELTLMKAINIREHSCTQCDISVLKYQFNLQEVKIELLTINFVIDHLSAIISPPHAVEENFAQPRVQDTTHE